MTSQDNRTKAADALRQKAESLVREEASRTPEDSASLSPEEIQQTLHQLRLHQIELELQNEEVRTAQARIEAERTRYFNLYDLAPVGYCTLSKKGLILEANLTAATLLGVSRIALFKQPISRFILKDDQDIYYLHQKQLFETGEPQETELRLVKSDGALFWAYLTATTAQAEDGGLLCRVVLNDITERKRSEDALRESEEKYRLLIDNLNEGIWQIDKDGYTVFVNDSMAEMLGYTVQEMQGKHLFDFMDAQESRLTKNYMQRRQKGIKEQHEHILVCKDGSYIFTSLETSPVYNKDGKYIGALAGVQDVTARKRAEEALRHSENYYRAIFETSASAIFILEEDTTISHVNSNFEKLLGYSKQEVEGKKSWTEFVHPDDLSWMRENHYLRRREPRGAPLNYEFRFFVRNGESRHGFLTVDMIPGTSQSVVSLIDITERKRTEEARRKSEERYRTILNEMSEGYQEVDLSGNFTFFNEAFLNIFGYNRDEMMGTNFKHYAAEEAIAKKVYRRYNEMYKTGGTIQNSEWDIIRKDGERRTLEYYASVVKDSKDSPTGFRGIVRDITDRKKAENQMRLQSLVLNQIEDRVTVTDFDGIITYVNEAEVNALGYPREELIGASIEKYGDNPDRSVTQQEILEKTLKHGAWRGEVVNRTIDGQEIVLDARTQLVLDDQGNRIALAGIATDITERKRAENEQKKLQAQLAQAQKMESVGRLAGGVAHDFNNKLAIINGYAEIAMETIDPSDPLLENIQEIQTAGQQSAAIVRQLLAFARQQTISPVQLDLNDTISSILKMLQRLIGENVHLEWHPGSNLAPVKMDPSQVDQIMANLAVNARDAISDVGKLTIETQNTVVDEDYCRGNPEAIPGQYVMLAVSDDGCGIEKAVREQLFDPYFTTKEVGKGTGLGLPTIYGIVKQNNGFINVYSEPGEGTTFKLYFPSHEEAISSADAVKEASDHMPRGTETVLVVEDEKTILQMSKQMLERLGYTVETAGSTAEALQISKQYDGTINLLITDVIMPEMNGRDLSGQMVKSHPGLKTLYMSGYTANVIAHHGVLDEGVQFIQKPFTLRDLAGKVREVLEQG